MGINTFDQLAFPVSGTAQEIRGIGMTKRELFAALAMQAQISLVDAQDSTHVAHKACLFADALLARLNQSKDD